jgi:hypothetical protein
MSLLGTILEGLVDYRSSYDLLLGLASTCRDCHRLRMQFLHVFCSLPQQICSTANSHEIIVSH